MLRLNMVGFSNKHLSTKLFSKIELKLYNLFRFHSKFHNNVDIFNAILHFFATEAILKIIQIYKAVRND
jgi:hypothetical protein